MATTYEKDVNNEEPIRCDMHFDGSIKPYFIQTNEVIYYRIDADGNIDSVACEECAKHFNWVPTN